MQDGVMDALFDDQEPVEFADLESRYGLESALAILRTLEQFEGVTEKRTAKMSAEDRLQQVMNLMRENLRYQTQH